MATRAPDDDTTGSHQSSAQRSLPPPPELSGITMFGARQTGKTTFLGALRIALLRQASLGWSLIGGDSASARALTDFVNDMADGHIFPVPTADIANYDWSLHADLPVGSAWDWRRFRFRRHTKHVSIPLDLVDSPGEAADGRALGQARSDQLISNLARSAGILLFFDPVSEFERGDAFRHMFGVLTQLQAQWPVPGTLPHHVAVCITKFDEMPVFEAAQKLRLVTYDVEPPELPRIITEDYGGGDDDRDARAFFARLVRISKSHAAELVLPLLEQTFHKERVRFFATSAIGFYIGPHGVFDPDDYQNHIPREEPDGIDHIRGGIYPINVVEPVLWLSRNVARTTR